MRIKRGSFRNIKAIDHAHFFAFCGSDRLFVDGGFGAAVVSDTGSGTGHACAWCRTPILSAYMDNPIRLTDSDARDFFCPVFRSCSAEATMFVFQYRTIVRMQRPTDVFESFGWIVPEYRSACERYVKWVSRRIRAMAWLRIQLRLH